MKDIDNNKPKVILFPRQFDNISVPFAPNGSSVKLGMIFINGLMNTNKIYK